MPLILYIILKYVLEAIDSLGLTLNMCWKLLIPLVSPYWQYYLSKIKIINLYTFVVSLLGVKMFSVFRHPQINGR